MVEKHIPKSLCQSYGENFVDVATDIARKDIKDQHPGSLNLSMDLSGNTNVAAAKALFARVNVRTVGADQAIYSDTVQLK